MFVVNASTFVRGKRLPKTNLEPLVKPPGLSSREEIIWGLAQLLEGQQGVYQANPSDWDSSGNALMRTSKYLSVMTRHSADLAEAHA